MADVKKHGIYEQETKDVNIQCLERLGYFVLKNVLSSEWVSSIRDKLYAIYKIQAEEVGGEQNLKKMKDEGTARALFAHDVCLTRSLSAPRAKW